MNFPRCKKRKRLHSCCFMMLRSTNENRRENGAIDASVLHLYQAKTKAVELPRQISSPLYFDVSDSAELRNLLVRPHVDRGRSSGVTQHRRRSSKGKTESKTRTGKEEGEETTAAARQRQQQRRQLAERDDGRRRRGSRGEVVIGCTLLTGNSKTSNSSRHHDGGILARPVREDYHRTIFMIMNSSCELVKKTEESSELGTKLQLEQVTGFYSTKLRIDKRRLRNLDLMDQSSRTRGKVESHLLLHNKRSHIPCFDS
ncbi:hypothetical protein F2P81_012144 [Scophthalmus maximus]|uniref:Uncharacterized protein n=1 Tax=Scophthalmus maximus TaxID=52904 RepID=A0A6A4SGV8_SCOMX|nr:hypothetical protein F2P81_012144 [Scophthalmus maximus]